jgi:hypothetical protein
MGNIHIFRRRPGKLRMNVEVGYEFHGFKKNDLGRGTGKGKEMHFYTYTSTFTYRYFISITR